MLRNAAAALPPLTVSVIEADVIAVPAGIVFWVSNFSSARR